MDPLSQELKALIIQTLNLDDVTPETLADDEPLFGEGLGLDSIDALELTVALEKTYGVRIPDASVGRRVFRNVMALAGYVRERRQG